MPYRILQKKLTAAQIGGSNGLKEIQKAMMKELLDDEFDRLCDGRLRTVVMDRPKPVEIEEDPQAFNVSVVIDHALARPQDAKIDDAVHRTVLTGDPVPEGEQFVEGPVAHWGALTFHLDAGHWRRTA